MGMPDYIYLLENRLSSDQRHALRQLRDVAAEAGTILFLTGDAVRDLTSGHAVRELEVAVHGDALKLKKAIIKTGGKIWGEDEASKTLYLCFPGTVRVDFVSTQSVEYPKPGKPVYHLASIQEDLRRRDFTANAMAISLNEGSFGLLMDPLNGAADIELRTLRLVSNYGFLEEPGLLVRGTRYRARLGWEFDPRTQTRYENAKTEGVIEFLSAHARAEELEQIGHEEEALKVLEALDAEGWMKVLCPGWTPAKANVEGLKTLHEQAVELLLQGVHPDMSAAQMELLTAKMPPKELAALKKQLLRPGFVEEWNGLDALAAGFAKALTAKANQVPSAMFKLFTSYDPEAILWLGFTTKDTGIRERYNLFLKVWPEARQRIPHALMQEMRITPELPNYSQVVESVFLELIDGRLTTPEEMRAFLEPHSPPAPPPQVTIKRTRARRGAEPKVKEAAFDEEESEEGLEEEDIDDLGGDEEEDEGALGIAKGDLTDEREDEDEGEEEGDDEASDSGTVKRGAKGVKSEKPVKQASATSTAKVGKTVAPAKPDPKSAAPAKSDSKVEKLSAASAPAAQKTAQKPAPVPPVAPSAAAPKGKPAAEATKPKPGTEPAKAKPAAAPKAAPIAKPAPAPAKAAEPAVATQAKKQPPAKPAQKTAVKASPKPAHPAKGNAKAPAKNHSAKSAPAKAKPAAGAKSAKAQKTAKPAPKKPASKTSKKR
jgi:tRNA nucleotidyltransferase (CCA-adding enzyme)